MDKLHSRLCGKRVQASRSLNNQQSNNKEEFDLEEAIFSEVLHPLDEIEEFEDIFSPPPDNPQEEVSSIDESRASIQQLAMANISFEQLKQKIQYDKKFNEWR